MKIDTLQIIVHLATYWLPQAITTLQSRVSTVQAMFLQFIIHASILALAFKFDSAGLLLTAVLSIVKNAYDIHKVNANPVDRFNNLKS